MSKNEDNCPYCKTSFDGGSILQTFLDQGKSQEEAEKSAAMYGGTRWSRKINIYDRDKDRTVQYKCPDCGKTWDRDW